MSVQIAHASLDENGKTSGGNPGDQTGKEVCIRSWHSKPWNVVLRATDSTMREKIAQAMKSAAPSTNTHTTGASSYAKNNAFTFGTYSASNNINGVVWREITVNTSGVYKIYLSSLLNGTYGASGWTADRRIELLLIDGNTATSLGTAGSQCLYPSVNYQQTYTMSGSIFIPSIQLTAGQKLQLKFYEDSYTLHGHELIIFK